MPVKSATADTRPGTSQQQQQQQSSPNNPNGVTISPNEITIEPFYVVVDSQFFITTPISAPTFIAEINLTFNNGALCLSKSDLENTKNAKKPAKDSKKKDEEKKDDTSASLSLIPSYDEHIFSTLNDLVASEVATRKVKKAAELQKNEPNTSTLSKSFPLYVFLLDIVQNPGDALKIGVHSVFYQLSNNALEKSSPPQANSRNDLLLDSPLVTNEATLRRVHAFDRKISELKSSTLQESSKEQILSSMDNPMLKTLFSLRFSDSIIKLPKLNEAGYQESKRLIDIVFFPFTYSAPSSSGEVTETKAALLTPVVKEKVEKKSPKKLSEKEKLNEKPAERNETLSILLSGFRASLVNYYSYRNDYQLWVSNNIAAVVPKADNTIETTSKSLFDSYSDSLANVPVNAISLPMICLALCKAAGGETNSSSNQDANSPVGTDYKISISKLPKYPATFPMIAAGDVDTLRFCTNVQASTHYDENFLRKPIEILHEAVTPFTSTNTKYSLNEKEFSLQFEPQMLSKTVRPKETNARFNTNSLAEALKQSKFKRVFYENEFQKLFLTMFLAETSSSQLFSTLFSRSQLKASEFYAKLLDAYFPFKFLSTSTNAKLQLFLSTMQHKIKMKLAKAISTTQKHSPGFHSDTFETNPHFDIFSPNFPANIFDTFSFFNESQWTVREELDRDNLYRRLQSIATSSIYKNAKVSSRLCKESGEYLVLCWEKMPLQAESKETYSEYFSPNLTLPQFIDQFPLFSSLPSSSPVSLMSSNKRQVYDWDVEVFNGKLATRQQLYYLNSKCKLGLLVHQVSNSVKSYGLFSSPECEINVNLRDDAEKEELPVPKDAQDQTCMDLKSAPQPEAVEPQPTPAPSKPGTSKKSAVPPKSKSKAEVAAAIEKERLEQAAAASVAANEVNKSKPSKQYLTHNQCRYVAHFKFQDSSRLLFEGEDDFSKNCANNDDAADKRSRSYFNYVSQYGLHFEVTDNNEVLIWNATEFEKFRKIDINGNIYRLTVAGKEEKFTANGDMYYRTKGEEQWKYIDKTGTTSSCMDGTKIFLSGDSPASADSSAISDKTTTATGTLPAINQVDTISGAQIYLHSNSLVCIQYVNGSTVSVFEDGSRIFRDESNDGSFTITVEHPACPAITIQNPSSSSCSDIRIDVRDGSKLTLVPVSRRVHVDHASKSTVLYNDVDRSILFFPAESRMKMENLKSNFYESFINNMLFESNINLSPILSKDLPQNICKIRLSPQEPLLSCENHAMETFTVNLTKTEGQSMLSRLRRNRPTNAAAEALPPSTPPLDKDYEIVYNTQQFPMVLPRLFVIRQDGTGYELHTQPSVVQQLEKAKLDPATNVVESRDGNLVHVHILTSLPNSDNGYVRPLLLPDLLRAFPPHLLYPIRKYQDASHPIITRQHLVYMPPISREDRNKSIDQWKVIEESNREETQVLSDAAGLTSSALPIETVDKGEFSSIANIRNDVTSLPNSIESSQAGTGDASQDERQFNSFFATKRQNSNDATTLMFSRRYREISHLPKLLQAVSSNLRANSLKFFPELTEITDVEVDEFFVHPVSEFDAQQKEFFTHYLNEMVNVLDSVFPLVKHCEDILSCPYNVSLRQIASTDPLCRAAVPMVGEFVNSLLHMLGFENEKKTFECIVENEILFARLHEVQYQLVAYLNKFKQKLNEFELIPIQKNEKMSKIEEEKINEGDLKLENDIEEGGENGEDFSVAGMQTSPFMVEFPDQSSTNDPEDPNSFSEHTPEMDSNTSPFGNINRMPKPLRLATHLSHGRSFKESASGLLTKATTGLPSILSASSSDFIVSPTSIELGRVLKSNTIRVTLDIMNTDTTVKRIQISQPVSDSSITTESTSPSSTLNVARTFYLPGLLAPGMHKRCEVEFYAGSAGDFSQVFTIRSERTIAKIPITAQVVREKTPDTNPLDDETIKSMSSQEEKTNRRSSSKNDIILPPIASRPSSQSQSATIRQTLPVPSIDDRL